MADPLQNDHMTPATHRRRSSVVLAVVLGLIGVCSITGAARSVELSAVEDSGRALESTEWAAPAILRVASRVLGIKPVKTLIGSADWNDNADEAPTFRAFGFQPDGLLPILLQPNDFPTPPPRPLHGWPQTPRAPPPQSIA